MVKTIKLQPHLTSDELARRYRAAQDPVARSHYQIIWLLSAGKTTSEVMAATGYSRGWVQQLAKRYNADGPAALGDRRHHNPGGAARALLDEAGQQELRDALAGDAPAGGLWSGRKVAEWIAHKVGRVVRPQRGWEYLRRLGHVPKVPRPAHEAADAAEQAAFPKG
jgi:transposase